MSYVALATNSFDAVTRFYSEDLGLPATADWDRANGRGRRFDLGGLTLEILDNTRERQPLSLPPPADRFHVVIEVDDIAAARGRLRIRAPSAASRLLGCGPLPDPRPGRRARHISCNRRQRKQPTVKRLIIGISGASGVIYGVRLLEVLRGVAGIETHVVLSPAARRTLALENGPYRRGHPRPVRASSQLNRA